MFVSVGHASILSTKESLASYPIIWNNLITVRRSFFGVGRGRFVADCAEPSGQIFKIHG